MPDDSFGNRAPLLKGETSKARAVVGLGALMLEGVGTVSLLLVEASQSASVEKLGVTMVGGLVAMIVTGVATGKR